MTLSKIEMRSGITQDEIDGVLQRDKSSESDIANEVGSTVFRELFQPSLLGLGNA